jgi:hypothetical protein
MTQSTDSSSVSHLAQAKLFAEVARRTERPLDALPEGDAQRVLLVLWQEAARAARAAADDPRSVDPPSASTREVLERAAGGAALWGALERALERALEEPSAQARLAHEEVAARVASFSGFTLRLADAIERPEREVRRQRATKFAARWLPVAAGVVALVTAAWSLFGPADLTRRATRTLSSELGDCKRGECGDATFHIRHESSPWVRYDFGAQQELRSIAVRNRTDCCYERAIPLVVETSDDGKIWSERVRTERPFVDWSATFRARARFLRLRIAGTSYLHLKSVTIR